MRKHALLVSVNLPTPPSVNQAFAGRRGSHLTQKTAAYHFWERQVFEEYGYGRYLPVLAPGSYGLWLDLNPAMRGDIDNRVKLVSDVLKWPSKGSPNALGIVLDDEHMKSLYVGFGTGLAPERCAVTVVSLAEWPAYVVMRLEP